jgi:hypothetical protein
VAPVNSSKTCRLINEIMQKHLSLVWPLALTALLFAIVAPAFDGLPLNASGQVTADRHSLETSDFSLIGMGNGVAKDGAKAAMNTYMAPGGNKVFQAIIYYASDDRTKDAFEVQAKRATKIIDRGPVLNGRSHVMEQRLVYELIGRNEQTISEVMVTDGHRLVKIDSSSMADTLRFEKEIIKIRDEVKKGRDEKKARALAASRVVWIATPGNGSCLVREREPGSSS